MSFAPRIYPEIVRDLLTVLTGGTVAESHPVGPGDTNQLFFDERPVRRVSHIQGEIDRGNERRPFRFTEREYELIPTDDNPDEYVGVRFKDDAPHPAAGTNVSVNYYPVRLRPTPLNDVNAGSVVRTLIETVSREMATQYEQLRLVYESAFVGTAVGVGLDNVSALVGVKRLARGHPVGKVRFARRAGSPGDVFIPNGTAITDGKGNRYLTSDDASMLPSQGNVEVWVHGESTATATVDGGVLAVLERALAGVDTVVNDAATFRAAEEETDAQLADRARRAIHGTGRGTLDAIRSGVEALRFVSAVSLTEHPDGIPGTLRIDIALTEDNAFNRNMVERAIDANRPAGILVDRNYADHANLAFAVHLVLAGSFQPTSALTEIQAGVTQRLMEATRNLAPGATLRRAQLLAVVLTDNRIVDATLTPSVDGSAAAEDSFALPVGKAVRVDPTTGVQFDPFAYESQPAAGTAVLINVDAETGVAFIDPAVDSTAAQAVLRSALQGVLASTAAGASITIEQVLNGIRDVQGFAVTASTFLLQFEEEAGAFTELRPGDPPFNVPANATLQLRDVRVVES